MQNHYNLVYREEEREMIPLCIDQGLGIIPWSPLARGFLAGNRPREGAGTTARSTSDQLALSHYQGEDFVIADRVSPVAKGLGKTMPQVALAWMLSKSYITAPIVGASKLLHLEQAVEALSITLSAEQISMLEEPYRPHRILGHI